MKRICAACFFALLPMLLVFSGCSAVTGFPQEEGEAGLRIFINCNPFSERTFSPDFDPLPVFPKYYITLTREGNNTADYAYTLTGADRENPVLTNVIYGKYTIIVRGYLSTGDNVFNNSAIGTLVHTYNGTTSGQNAIIKLGPVITEGTGTLNYKITDLSGIVSYPVLINYSDLDAYPNIDPGDDPEYPYVLAADGQPGTMTLPAGYYALLSRNDVLNIVHIYRNFVTEMELEIETTDKAADPVASVAGGQVPYGTIVELSCATPGAEIYYTVDGSDPAISGSLYAGPISIVSSPLTIRAYALVDGINPSNKILETYIVKVETPTASPAGAALAKGTTVALSCATPGVSIRYTTDGSTPTASSPLYSAPVTVNSNMTIKAIALIAGIYSEVMEESYTLIIRTVTFDENYPEGEAEYDAVIVPDGSALGANMPSPPEREGWLFAGWDCAIDGSGPAFDDTTVVTGDITVYAQWEEVEEPGGGDPGDPGDGEPEE